MDRMHVVTRLAASPLAFLFMAKALAGAAAAIVGVSWFCTRRAAGSRRNWGCGHGASASRRCPECGTERGRGMLVVED
jgi:hypothetical protein